MATYANVPVNSHVSLGQLSHLLSGDAGPLSVKPSLHLPTMIPWAALFAWNCRASAVEHTAAALGALLSRAEAGWDGVWKQAGIDMAGGTMGEHATAEGQSSSPWRAKEGYLILQRSEADMRRSRAGAELRRRFVPGLQMRQLSSDEVLQLEPNLNPDTCGGGAWFFPEAWYLKDPGALLRRLAGAVEAGGGVIRTGKTVVAIQDSDKDRGDGMTRNQTNHGAVCALLDDGTRFSADEIVVAAGAHSAPLASSFCPLDTERGYSITFAPGSESALARAVCDPGAGWIATPMAGGLRVAGKVELGGTRAAPTPALHDRLEREARALLGDGVGRRVAARDWLGCRPTMPDALPVIGRSRRRPESVFYAFGHQHVGWTLGGITGQLIAELVQGKETAVDLAPYCLDRFRFRNQIRGRR